MSRDLSASELHDLGSSYFDRGDYRVALNLLSRSIDLVEFPSLELLDRRAAGYQKLEDWSGALKDGRTMMKSFTKDPRGYLRSGTSLEQMGKPETAFNIYRLGVTRSVATGAGFKLLNRRYKVLLARQRPEKLVDPTSILPMELMEMILQQLSFKQRVRCLKVSRTWQQILASSPRLWFEIDTRQCHKAPRPRTLSRYIKYSNNNVKSLSMGRFHDIDQAYGLLPTCRSLESLVLDNAVKLVRPPPLPLRKSLKHVLFSAKVEINLTDALEVLFACSDSLITAHFQHVDFRKCDFKQLPKRCKPLPLLQSLTLRDGPVSARGPDRSEIELMPVIQCCVNLQQLVFIGLHGSAYAKDYDFSCLSKLEYLELGNSMALEPPILPQSLQQLIGVSGSHILFGYPLVLIGQDALPRLERLQFNEYFDENFIPALGLLARDWSERSQRLLYFGTQDSSSLESSTEESMAIFAKPRFSSIETISLEGRVGDEFVCRLPDVLHNLRQVNLSATQITGVSVRALVNKLRGQLEKLLIDNCEGVGLDAVEWARSRGVEVSNHMTRSRGFNETGRRIFT